MRCGLEIRRGLGAEKGDDEEEARGNRLIIAVWGWLACCFLRVGVALLCLWPAEGKKSWSLFVLVLGRRISSRLKPEICVTAVSFSNRFSYFFSFSSRLVLISGGNCTN